jgi:hypothetical protein
VSTAQDRGRCEGETTPVRDRQLTADALRPIVISYLDGLGVPPDRADRLVDQTHAASSDPDHLIPVLLALTARCGARPRDSIYLSTPITTGRNHLPTLGRGEVADTAAHDAERHAAIEANRRRARAVATQLRGSGHPVVIDPTGLVDVPGWAQDDYHALWIAVIEAYARVVVFVDEWQYSVGCTKEFEAAARLGLPLRDQRLAPLTYQQGIRMLDEAEREVGAVPGHGARLVRAIRTARSAVGQRRGPEDTPEPGL